MMQLAAYSAALFTGCMVCHGEARADAPESGIADRILFLHRRGWRLGGNRCGPAGPADIPKLLGVSAGGFGCIAVVLGVSMREGSSWWHTGRSFAGAADSLRHRIACATCTFSAMEEAARLPRWAAFARPPS